MENNQSLNEWRLTSTTPLTLPTDPKECSQQMEKKYQQVDQLISTMKLPNENK